MKNKIFASICFVVFVTVSATGWSQISTGEAVDARQLVWTKGGNTPHGVGQSLITHDGVDAWQTGNIDHDQVNWVQTTVVGPAVLSFWWKASTEADFDLWTFYMVAGDNYLIGELVDTAAISGETNWNQRTFNVPEGTHTLRWEYLKDSDTDGGTDRAWLDQVVLAPEAPSITEQPMDILTPVGSNVLFSVGFIATQQKFIWQFNGTNLVNRTNATLSLTNVQLNQSGPYRVIITNGGGSVTSEVATLTVFQPLPLASGLDTTGLIWTTGGTLPWFAFTNSALSHDGIDVARGPLVPDDSETVALESWLETRVNGPGTIKFWWKLSGLETDTLRFFIAGFDQLVLPAEDGGWEQVTLAVSAGTNKELRWLYTRDDFINTDETDSAYLDEVVFIPATNSPPRFSFPSYSGTGFSALITHDPNRAYRVQGSTNLTVWTDVTNFNHAASQFQFYDTSGTNRLRRFYRVVTTP